MRCAFGPTTPSYHQAKLGSTAINSALWLLAVVTKTPEHHYLRFRRHSLRNNLSCRSTRCPGKLLVCPRKMWHTTFFSPSKTCKRNFQIWSMSPSTSKKPQPSHGNGIAGLPQTIQPKSPRIFLSRVRSPVNSSRLYWIPDGH